MHWNMPGYEDLELSTQLVIKKKYRFLVIGDAVRGILHRVPARVVGDGRRRISELIHEKNGDPLRGKGYHHERHESRQLPQDMKGAA